VTIRPESLARTRGALRKTDLGGAIFGIADRLIRHPGSGALAAELPAPVQYSRRCLQQLEPRRGSSGSERGETMAEIWPQEIRLLKDRRALIVSFDNGETHALSAEYLRTHSPSAEVQGHSPEQRKTVGGKEDVQILKVEPVGNYAVKLVFDDMHDTGIFSWGYLRKLGQEFETRWPAYLEELAEKGMTRRR
jgi:DUF971 family protein